MLISGLQHNEVLKVIGQYLVCPCRPVVESYFAPAIRSKPARRHWPAHYLEAHAQRLLSHSLIVPPQKYGNTPFPRGIASNRHETASWHLPHADVRRASLVRKPPPPYQDFTMRFLHALWIGSDEKARQLCQGASDKELDNDNLDRGEMTPVYGAFFKPSLSQ